MFFTTPYEETFFSFIFLVQVTSSSTMSVMKKENKITSYTFEGATGIISSPTLIPCVQDEFWLCQIIWSLFQWRTDKHQNIPQKNHRTRFIAKLHKNGTVTEKKKNISTLSLTEIKINFITKPGFLEKNMDTMYSVTVYTLAEGEWDDMFAPPISCALTSRKNSIVTYTELFCKSACISKMQTVIPVDSYPHLHTLKTKHNQTPFY